MNLHIRHSKLVDKPTIFIKARVSVLKYGIAILLFTDMMDLP